MNTDSLFKRFDELADAPERIPALRKVILTFLLHSAVGSPDAAARATKLREAHEKRRNELSKGSSGQRLSGAQIVADEDLPPSLSDIPTTLFARLGDVASIEKGLSQIQSTKPGKYPLVVTAETRSSSESFEFEGAAAIVPLVSSTGHGDASLKRLHYQEGRYAVGNILAVVRPIIPELLRARFIFEYLSAFKEELLVSRMSGTANVSLTVNKLKEVPVPLVSGLVLSRIDELMALCDRLGAQQQERESRARGLAHAALARFAAAPTPANLTLLFHPSFSIPPFDLRKSILTLAVQGKLVPQDPQDEPVPISAATPLVQQFPVPEGWAWIHLGDIEPEFQNGVSSRGEKDGDPVVVIRLADITSRRISLRESRSIAIARQQIAKYKLETGDTLITRVNGSADIVGTFIPVLSSDDAIYCDHFIRMRIDPERLFPSYTALLGDSPLVREQIGSLFVTTAGQKTVNQEHIRSLCVPLPPLAEQRRIVAKVEQLLALVDALEQQLAASRATAEKLLTALVAELTSANTAKPRVLMAAEDPGHYGATVKVPDLTSSLEFTRTVLAAEIVHRMHGDRTFGQIKFQKALYLTENIFQLSQVDSHPERYQNGPHDPELIAQVEAKMKEYEWFEAASRTGGHGQEYHALPKAGTHQAHFEKLWPKQAAAIRKLIDEMKAWKTERCERFATLYAAWNDLLIWDKPADDAAILDQVLNHWHSAKQQIPRSSWQEMLSWMKREGYIPIGFGRSTVTKPQAELFIS